MGLAQREVIGGDVLLGTRETFFGDRELVHEGEAEVLLLTGEIDFEEAAAELAGGFPTDLAAETGFVASSVEPGKPFQEKEKNRFEEVPIFGASGEERAETENGRGDFVDVDDGEIAVAGCGDVETESQLDVGAWSVGA